MDDGNGVIFNPVYSGPLTSTVVFNVTSSVTYSFYVAAVNFNGEGPFSPIG